MSHKRWAQVGAVLAVPGTVLVCGGAEVAGMALWMLANPALLWAAILRRDWTAVAMFGVYTGATAWGLGSRVF